MQSEHFRVRGGSARIKNVLSLAAVCVAAILALSPASASSANHPAADWRIRLQEELPLLGHRNWIAVVDSAYPLQTSSGIETIDTNADQIEVLRTVLAQIGNTRHVRPV